MGGTGVVAVAEAFCHSGRETRLTASGKLPAMPRVRAGIIAGAVIVLLLAVFFEAPVVGYTQSVTIPDDYKPQGYPTCEAAVFGTPTTTATVTFVNASQPANLTQEFQQYQECMNNYLYPPEVVSGSSTLAYSLFGIGPPPLPDWVVFSRGNYTAVVVFDGRAATAAYEFYVPGGDLTVEPEGVVQIINASVERTGYGNLVFSAAVKNIGSSTLNPVGIDVFGLPLPAYTGLSTVHDGLNWYFGGAGDNCAALLGPGSTCTMTSALGNVTSAAPGISFTVGVIGVDNGRIFFYSQDFVQPFPEPGLNHGWVDLFMGRVDGARTGPGLTENSTLDRFAALRFKTASSEPGISDYGFASDSASFFGAGATNSSPAEILLFPGDAAPYLYATELQSSGPSHWTALTNPDYTQFGYYVGEAPYYEVSANCPVTEVPSAGVNITQYFESHGCIVTLAAGVPWLVVILST